MIPHFLHFVKSPQEYSLKSKDSKAKTLDIDKVLWYDCSGGGDGQNDHAGNVGLLIQRLWRWGKSFMLGLWESEQRRKKVSEILEGPKGHSASPVVWGVDMASGESRSVTMTIGSGGEAKTFPVQDVTFTGKPIWKGKNPLWQEISFYAADDLVWYDLSLQNKPKSIKTISRSVDWSEMLDRVNKWFSEALEQQEEKDMGVGRQMDAWRKAMNDPAEFIKIYFDAMNEEENVNYLFEVCVIDLKEQELVGSHHVVCSDVSRAVTVATLRHELKEDELSNLKFHVNKICEVPAWDGD